jgi:DNA-binding NtrC family response regulator|tara:strand:- start:213 stop:611 length:399 start_codon:yes stop_codon:yes gene_type:complete
MNIVVVDDLAPITLTYKAVLTRAGYDVEAFTRPEEALEYLQSGNAAVDLLITDIYMPEVNGLDLITAAKSVNGATKTLCITGGGGFDQDTSLMQTAREISDQVIYKPIHSVQLVDTVRKLIGTGQQGIAANG